MNRLERCFTRTILVALVAVLLSASGILVAAAQGPLPTFVTINAPSQVSLGEVIQVEATLRDTTGTPIEGVTTRFLSYAEYLSGSTGFLELGAAVTDEEGVATFKYQPRRTGNLQLTVKSLGDGSYASSEATADFTVDGNYQFYKAHAGIQVPFLNKWLLVGVIGFLWSMLLLVGYFVLRIALAPQE